MLDNRAVDDVCRPASVGACIARIRTDRGGSPGRPRNLDLAGRRAGDTHGPSAVSTASAGLPCLADDARDDVRGADQARDTPGRRTRQQLRWPVKLQQPPSVEHANAIGDLAGFLKIVGCHQRRHAYAPAQRGELQARLPPRSALQRREGVVQQQHVEGQGSTRAPRRCASAPYRRVRRARRGAAWTTPAGRAARSRGDLRRATRLDVYDATERRHSWPHPGAETARSAAAHTRCAAHRAASSRRSTTGRRRAR